MAKRKVTTKAAKKKAAEKRETKRTARMVGDRRAKAKVRTPKAPKEKKPRPSLFERIGESPIKNLDKPTTLTQSFLIDELDCCAAGVNWVKEWAPRGFPMEEKRAVEVMSKDGASIHFDRVWPSFIMNSFLARAMNTVKAGSDQYNLVVQHCALVSRSFKHLTSERWGLHQRHIAAGIGSQRETYIDLVKILINHYAKL